MNLYKNTFDKLVKSSYQGVEGVFVVDSGVEGPCFGITVCTHGNEPCGLAIASKFLSDDVKLTQGRVIVVLNNIQATENYLNATTEEEKSACRFVDVNMNRLPDDLSGDSYEVKRTKELLPIWNEFDYALDIHSTSQPTEPMIIEGIGDASHITKNIPVEIVIRNIIQTQLGTPALGFYGDDCVSIGIEAGSHETDDSMTVAIKCTENILTQLGMIEGEQPKTFEQKIYTVHSSVILPDESYELARQFPMFGEVAEGEIVAKGEGVDITSPISGATIMAPKGLRPSNYNEEALFICSF